MKVTDRGLHVIKQWERYRAIPYSDGFKSDGSKVYSIGFGHSNYLSNVTFTEGSIWTQEYASEVLLQDLEYFGSLLKPYLKIEVPDEIWSICMSLCMNKGAKALYTSPQWEILHGIEDKYHKDNFCESILKYGIHAKNKETGVLEEKRGLRWRRIAEAGIYLQDRFKDYV